jgi:hypothetical protein
MIDIIATILKYIAMTLVVLIWCMFGFAIVYNIARLFNSWLA